MDNQKARKRLNDLRNDYKGLAISKKTNSKKAKKLLKEIFALDKALKDLDSSVGVNYSSTGWENRHYGK